jgi:hypothetical protein
MLVLDVGSGGFPNASATILCERELVDNRHRAGDAVVIDRPMVRADATALPFRDKAIDFVIASHLAEHVEDPASLCAELGRVAWAGYIETPSPLADVLLEEEYHIWRVGERKGAITFTSKRPQGRWTSAFTRRFYGFLYAGQTRAGHQTYPLPDNVVGRGARFALKVFGGALNRSGVMHTGYHFGPGRPLRCVVDGTPSTD